MIIVRIGDPREEELPRVGPAGTGGCRERRTCGREHFGPENQNSFRENVLQRQAALNQLLKQIGIDRIDIRTDRGYVEPLIRFFQQRARRLR